MTCGRPAKRPQPPRRDRRPPAVVRDVIAGIVLAAGQSSRLGRPKQLLDLGGRPLLQHVLDTAERSPLDEVVLVLGKDAGAVWAAMRPGPRVRVAMNRGFAEGQSTSLRIGLRALSPDADAAVVLLGDQPGIRVEAVAAVVESFRNGGGPVVQAAYGGLPGHPVLFARAVWPYVEAAAGDEGARAVIAAHPDWLHSIEVSGEPPEDVDTEEDYQRALRAFDEGG
jgi:molybdenum cofactor cytidylyltransferase